VTPSKAEIEDACRAMGGPSKVVLVCSSVGMTGAHFTFAPWLSWGWVLLPVLGPVLSLVLLVVLVFGHLLRTGKLR
jgi:hypothetical protein